MGCHLIIVKPDSLTKGDQNTLKYIWKTFFHKNTIRTNCFGVLDQSLTHPILLIYRNLITFYGNPWIVLVMRFQLTLIRIPLLKCPLLLHVWNKYLVSSNLYANGFTDASKNVSLAILSSFVNILRVDVAAKKQILSKKNQNQKTKHIEIKYMFLRNLVYNIIF